MSAVEEIERAISRLDPCEIERIAEWLESHRKQIARNLDQTRREAILVTAGCLSGEEGEEFARIVEEAGRSPMEEHGW